MKKNDGKREMVEEHGRGETVGLVGERGRGSGRIPEAVAERWRL